MKKVTVKQIKAWKWQGYGAIAVWEDSKGKHHYGTRFLALPKWVWERSDVTIRIYALGEWKEVQKR